MYEIVVQPCMLEYENIIRIIGHGFRDKRFSVILLIIEPKKINRHWHGGGGGMMYEYRMAGGGNDV